MSVPQQYGYAPAEASIAVIVVYQALISGWNILYKLIKRVVLRLIGYTSDDLFSILKGEASHLVSFRVTVYST